MESGMAFETCCPYTFCFPRGPKNSRSYWTPAEHGIGNLSRAPRYEFLSASLPRLQINIDWNTLNCFLHHVNLPSCWWVLSFRTNTNQCSTLQHGWTNSKGSPNGFPGTSSEKLLAFNKVSAPKIAFMMSLSLMPRRLYTSSTCSQGSQLQKCSWLTNSRRSFGCSSEKNYWPQSANLDDCKTKHQTNPSLSIKQNHGC